MTVTKDDITGIHSRVDSIEKAVLEVAASCQTVALNTSDVLVELKEIVTRREYEVKELESLKSEVVKVNTMIEAHIKDEKPTLDRVKSWHGIIDTFKKSIATNAGKLFWAVLIIGVATMFGADLAGLVK